MNGAAAGAGLSLAMACDVRIAVRTAVFVPAFISIGLVPDSGGSHFLTRILGPARALEWMLSGRRLTAEEALAWGLVSELVDADGLPDRAAELGATLAALPTTAVGLHKRLFDGAALHTLDEQLELEAHLQAAAAATADFAEGVAAFPRATPAQLPRGLSDLADAVEQKPAAHAPLDRDPVRGDVLAEGRRRPAAPVDLARPPTGELDVGDRLGEGGTAGTLLHVISLVVGGACLPFLTG